MHILDIWLEELKIFAPSNLKSLFMSIGRQLRETFTFLFTIRWWISVPFLFSHLIFYVFLLMTHSPNVIDIVRVLIICLKAYYAFLAALITFPAARAWATHFVDTRQSLVWPIVTPFVLWAYIGPHVYRFFAITFSYPVVMTVVQYVSFVLFLSIDWFGSPVFIFFAFIVIDTYVRHGVRYALNEAIKMIWYTYPTCVVAFAFVYGINWALKYFLIMMGVWAPVFVFAINPLAILIPIKTVIYGAIYQWHMQFVQDLE